MILLSQQSCVYHYSDVIIHTVASQITGVSIVCCTFLQAQIKENINAPRHWPLWGESIGHRWIPLTKSQQRGKCFHLRWRHHGPIRSSWYLAFWAKSEVDWSAKTCLRFRAKEFMTVLYHFVVCVPLINDHAPFHLLTHWGRGRMTDVSQTTYSNAFC